MALTYIGTRDRSIKATASEAILRGICPDGGLYIPEEIPKMEKSLEELGKLNYQELAYEVLSKFLDFTEEELKACIRGAYDEKFDTPEIVPVVKKGDALFLELFHGRTLAFKDMALSILPYLMKTAAKKNGLDKEIVILTATSGDTGKAALEGFANVEGTRIMVFFPEDGVSPVQKLQMNTQEGANTCVVGIKGNFDDAQSAVKSIFTDKALEQELAAKGFQFSSANSINIGRLVPQIVYYFWAYLQAVRMGEIKNGEALNFTVPTGNFGDILAGWYAMKMGLPVGHFVCASNDNKVLYDFFTTGTYDRRREFILTNSPSMDILISSNLERLIYLSTGSDPKANAALMKELAEDGHYTITDEMRAFMADFKGGFATEEENEAAIRTIFQDTGYLIDTHTGVAAAVYGQYKNETGDQTKTVIASTASPFKFSRSVMDAVKGKAATEGKDEFDVADELAAAAGLVLPKAVEEIRTATIRHDRECAVDEMEETVKNILGIS